MLKYDANSHLLTVSVRWLDRPFYLVSSKIHSTVQASPSRPVPSAHVEGGARRPTVHIIYSDDEGYESPAKDFFEWEEKPKLYSHRTRSGGN